MLTLLPLGQAQNETNGKSETGEMFLLGRHTIQQRRTGSQINTHKLQYLSYEVSIASRKKMTVINYRPLLRFSIHNHYVKGYFNRIFQGQPLQSASLQVQTRIPSPLRQYLINRPLIELSY